MSFDSGEALIEEIQSDWVRRLPRIVSARYGVNAYRRLQLEFRKRTTAGRFSRGLRQYAGRVLPQYADDWQETMMAASLTFIVKELGFSKVYFHEFETGNKLKRIDERYCAPPRSIYAKLPKKFCFRMVDQAPEFVVSRMAQQKTKKARERFPQDVRFWRLDLGEPTLH